MWFLMMKKTEEMELVGCDVDGYELTYLWAREQYDQLIIYL